MSRNLIAGFCFSLTLTSAVFGQGPKSATRLGPESLAGPSGPRVVEVQASESIRTAPEDGSTPVLGPPAPTMRQQIAAARSEVARRQLERLAPYNRYALPSADVHRTGFLQRYYLQSQVLPPATGIRPERTAAPVQLFQPGSTFSHVIVHRAENRRLADLEVRAEAARAIDARDRAAEGDTSPENLSDGSAKGNSEPRSLQVIDAERALNDARLMNARRRLMQLQSLSQGLAPMDQSYQATGVTSFSSIASTRRTRSGLTYSQLYQNLIDKVQLEIYENELQLQSLAKERRESTSR